MIELQDKRTWTKELIENIEKSLKIEEILNKYNIIGYHYTSLVNVEDVFENGLIGINDETIEKIKENIILRYPEKDKIINRQYKKYIIENKFDNRKNKIYFCCDNKQFNNGFEYIFKYYGGEITYNCFNNKILGKELLLNIGKPYIIKFTYKIEQLDLYVLYDLNKKIKNKLLNNKNIEMDFCLNGNVVAEDIIGAYEVGEYKNKYYIKRFIKNKNFKNR